MHGAFSIHLRSRRLKVERFILAIALLLTFASAAWADSTFKLLYNFTGGADGGLVAAAPVLDAQGNLYGVTYWGGTGAACGSNGCGVVFELTPSANDQWSESVPFDFTPDSGGASPGGVVVGTASDLFVGTYAVVPGGAALVFELTPTNGGWTFDEIYNQGGCCLTMGRNGSLFGAIGPGEYFGAGAVAELSPSPDGWTYTQLYSFCSLPNCADGWDPKYPLSWDSEGNLYGTTYDGGAYDYGVAFQLSHARAGTWTYHVMHSFAAFPTDGGITGSGLTLDSFGNAYGASYNGGANGNGAIYKLMPFPAAPWTWKETQIYNFSLSLQNGGFPLGTMVFDKAGNLYGTAGGGVGCGSRYGCGVVFKLSPGHDGQWTYSVVHTFSGSDGANPLGLAMDANGNLFGTTENGGTYNLGVVYEITP